MAFPKSLHVDPAVGFFCWEIKSIIIVIIKVVLKPRNVFLLNNTRNIKLCANYCIVL